MAYYTQSIAHDQRRDAAAQRQEQRAPTATPAAAAEVRNLAARSGSCVAAVYQQSRSLKTDYSSNLKRKRERERDKENAAVETR